MRKDTMAKKVRQNIAKLDEQKATIEAKLNEKTAAIQFEIDQQKKLLAILEPPQGEEASLDLAAPPAAVARKGAK